MCESDTWKAELAATIAVLSAALLAHWAGLF